MMWICTVWCVNSGTTVTASQLFKNLPVRRQFYGSKKKQREETKRVEDLLMQFGAVCPEVRFTLKVDKSVQWQKAAVADHRSVLLSIWGSGPLAHITHLRKTNLDLEVRLKLGVCAFMMHKCEAANNILHGLGRL